MGRYVPADVLEHVGHAVFITDEVKPSIVEDVLRDRNE